MKISVVVTSQVLEGTPITSTDMFCTKHFVGNVAETAQDICHMRGHSTVAKGTPKEWSIKFENGIQDRDDAPVLCNRLCSIMIA